MKRRLLVPAWGRIAILALSATAHSGAQNAVETDSEGVYTLEQARRGERIYRQQCSACHRDDLLGNTVDGGPPLRGLPFTTRWQGLGIATLLEMVEEFMPAGAPGSLGRQEYVDVLSFVLWANGVPAGEVELPASSAALASIVLHFEP